MIFRTEGREYAGATAAEVVRSLADDARGFEPRTHDSLYEFLSWSLRRLGDRIPPRELDLSARLDDETLARSYLLLCAEYRIGELTEDAP